MATNIYGTAVQGNPTNVSAQAELLKSADAVECIDKFVKTIPVAMNKNETISFSRAVTPDATVLEVAEGINPVSRQITYEQVTKTFEEYAEVFTVSSRQAELGEYDVLMHSKDRLLDLMKRIREKNAWYEYRAGTSVAYNSSAVTSRVQVNGVIALGRLRLAARALHNNRGQVMREMTKGSVNQATVPVEPAFVVLCHTDCRADIRNIPGFIVAAQVGGLKDTIPQLFGYVDEFCFITSPEFEPFLASGVAIGATGLRSVGGVSVDVYSYLVVAKDSLGKCSLRGAEKGGFGGIELNVLGKADKSDPTNQRRMVAARWWDAPVILNQNWLYRIECAVLENPL